MLQWRTLPTFICGHQLRQLEDGDVLSDACEAHVEDPGELADGRVPSAEELQDGPAGRVRERREGGIELR